tara:strand:+ start:536 stop:751 length:216 start_codon:yes stop_codon:yes gene_type:complete
MPVKVTYAADSLDTNPTVKQFDSFGEGSEWLIEEMQRRIDYVVQHSQETLSKSDLLELEETEMTLMSISDA